MTEVSKLKNRRDQAAPTPIATDGQESSATCHLRDPAILSADAQRATTVRVASGRGHRHNHHGARGRVRADAYDDRFCAEQVQIWAGHADHHNGHDADRDATAGRNQSARDAILPPVAVKKAAQSPAHPVLNGNPRQVPQK
jgi:hypothetical protein